MDSGLAVPTQLWSLPMMPMSFESVSDLDLAEDEEEGRTRIKKDEEGGGRSQLRKKNLETHLAGGATETCLKLLVA